MNRYLKYILPIICLVSCREEEPIISTEDTDAVELKCVDAEIAGKLATRAAALDAYNYVGRSAFVNNDSMVLTTIKRTDMPIYSFTYKGIVYNQEIEQGQTSGGWNRDLGKGSYLNDDGTTWSTDHPERIYWSDASNGHTYIGYSIPLQESGVTFDWEVRTATYEGSGTDGIPVYYGSIGNPRQLQTQSGEPSVITNFIDYTNNPNEVPASDDPSNPNSAKSYKTGNEKIQHDDLLLTWDNQKVAETGGSVAKLYYHHALALVRVVVNIQGFSASTDAADSKSVVKDMVLKDMLTMYKWRQHDYKAEALDATYDANNISDIYGAESGVTCDQKKDVHMWIPRPLGTGTGVGKQFTFYGLAVPRQMGVNNATTDAEKDQNLHFEFKVEYPDPMNPTINVVKDYKAMMPNQIEFRAGYCTTINIWLNHSNEQMTVGAEYMDWQMIETPDEGELKKNSTFLGTTSRDSVSIIGDPKANSIDDATWLYNGKDAQNKDVILDIYGNDGSATKPYTISTSLQLLSFAYEVKNGRDFTHQFVKLDADITLQGLADIKHDATGFYSLDSEGKRKGAIGVTWIGIGDDSHAFNGFFLGSGRHINNLYGEHFFYSVGANAVIDKLNFDNIIEVQGCGVVAHENNGLICGCYIDGDVKATNTSTQYTGSIVGTNNSFIIACAHVGKVQGRGTIGGLVGFNNGTMMACYHSGEISALDGSINIHATIGKRGDGTNSTNNSIAFSCYYDKSLIHHIPTLSPGKSGYPLSTNTMQSNAFVNADNIVFDYDSNGNYTVQNKTLREAVLEILGDTYQTKTDAELIAELLKDGVTSQNVQKLFKYHFSLNEALHVFKVWLDAIAAKANASTDANYKVQTNCHEFTKAQILFLQQHYTGEHKYIYTPATYPKVQ